MVEFGQMLFAGNDIYSYGIKYTGEAMLSALGEAIRVKREDDYALTDNGGEEEYVNDVFAMRTYCWCDNMAEGHEESCPPNFEFFDLGLQVNWYKHVGRGNYTNIPVSEHEWVSIITACLDSL